jgi:hypothetical protein
MTDFIQKEATRTSKMTLIKLKSGEKNKYIIERKIEELYRRKWRISTKAGEEYWRMRNLKNRIKRGIEEKKEEE